MKTPGFRLLIACCRWPDDERRAEAVREAATGFTDWTTLVALADRHRVEPLVAHGLAAAGIAVPLGIAAAAERTRADTLRDLAEMLRIADALAGAEIEHRFLKGIPLGVVSYGSVTLKRSWDIDLLVLPKDAVAAAACLARLDYAPMIPPRPFTNEEFARWSVVSKEAEFRSPRGTTVELHWRLSDHPALLPKIDASTPGRAVAVFGERSISTLADSPTLAYLAVHGTAHGWFRLKWIADFNAFLGSLPIDIRTPALSDAASHGVGHALATAIDLSDQLFRDKRSDPDPAIRRLTRHSMSALGADGERAASKAASRARWAIGPGLGYRISELRIRLRGTLDRFEHPLSGRWAALYPILRIPFWLHRRSFGRIKGRQG